MNANRTLSVPSRADTILVMLACAVFGFASSAKASPFMLNLFSPGSSGGGGGHVAGGAGNADISRLGLNVVGPVAQLPRSGGSRITDPSTTTPTTLLSSSPSSTSGAAGTTVQSLTAAVKSSMASLTASGPLSNLDLGNGETLSVSGTVADSMINSVSGSSSATGSVTPNTTEPSPPDTSGVANGVTNGGRGDLPGTALVPQRALSDTPAGSQAIQGSINSTIDTGINSTGLPSTVPDEMVQTVFADVASGIISTAAGITNLSPDVVAADDPIQAAEPATLVLFATGLTLTAHRLRRRR